jgi:hypothetical protein
MDKVTELEQKLGDVGGGPTTPQIITSLDPALQQAAGQPLTINGTFDFPLSGNVVTVGGLPIAPGNFLPGSDASHISFNLPDSLLGPVNIRVRRNSNQQEGERQGYIVLPPLQSTVPSPTLVADSPSAPNPSLFANAAQIARIGQQARLVGTNLAANASLLIRFQTGQGTFIDYPNPQAVPPRAGAVINTANTNSNQLVFTVPDIIEITSGAFPASVVFQVTIPGATNTASISGRVLR